MKKEVYWRCKETLRMRSHYATEKEPRVAFIEGKKYLQKDEYKGGEYLELIDEGGGRAGHTVTSGGMGWLHHFEKVEDETTEENSETKA